MPEIMPPIKALLIQPPRRGGVRTFLTHFNSEEGIGAKPPLGLLSIATYLARNSNHKVRVMDLQVDRRVPGEILEEIADYGPDLVGISTWTDFWYPAYSLGREIKKRLPGVHLNYGGPHVTIYPQETLDVEFVDSIVCGDGEVPFQHLARMLATGESDRNLPGLYLKNRKHFSTTFENYIHKDLDSLPIPDRTLLPIESYSSVLGRDEYVTTMITSRGCPNRCIFCKLNFQKTLKRSAENVVKEFAEIERLGIREVEIYDDTFTWSPQRVLDICDGLRQRDIRLNWSIRDRVNNANEELLKKMRQAGCDRIHYGIESGVDRVLKAMKKNITTGQAIKALQLAQKYQYTTLTYFMFGNLDETREDMEKTIAFARTLNSHYAEFSIVIPYPGTELYRLGLEREIIPNDYWHEFARNPTPDFEIPRLIENELDRAELRKMRDRAISGFYFRPGYVLRELGRLRSISEFRRKATMGWQLFRQYLNF